MRKKRNDFDAVGVERMTDAELSKKLGHYQDMSTVWFWMGMVCIVSGIISYFAVQNKALKALLMAVLFFGGIFCVLFISGGAQKTLKALMQEQLGDFFRAELEKCFGPDLHTNEMRIDEDFLKTLRLLEGEWEWCAVENFYEGAHRSLHFSTANVRLNHVYQKGCPAEGYETCTRIVFKGIVLRCETRVAAPSPILGNARTDESAHGVATDHEAFDRRFCVTAEPAQDAPCLLTPQFTELLTTLEQRLEGRLLSFYWDERVFSLALETDYDFAAVASNVDLRNLDAVRQSYAASLREMAATLDLLAENAALFAA